MKFSDIDFSAIGNMMKNLSQEDMDHLENMAQDMLASMAPKAQEMMEEMREPEVDFMEALQLDENLYSNLPGAVLNNLESAWDMENFYEDTELDADYSAAVLFYAKALLQLLRSRLYPYLHELPAAQALPGKPFEKSAGMTTLQEYLAALCSGEIVSSLIEQGVGDESFYTDVKAWVLAMQTALSRAEFDAISMHDLEALKQTLLASDALICLDQVL